MTRRIEGTFPNYKQLIPKETVTNAVISAEEFTAAVKRVSLMALHNTPLKISISVADQTLSLSATTQDVGDASEDLLVKAEGEDVEIAFNHAFLMDGLSSASSGDSAAGSAERAQAWCPEDGGRRRVPLSPHAGQGRLGRVSLSIKRLELKDFRSYESFEMEPGERIIDNRRK